MASMITLHFTEQQVVALTGLLDGGLRHIGIRAAKDAAEIFAELERATLEAKSAPSGVERINGHADVQ